MNIEEMAGVMLPALIAGILIVLTHVPLGLEVLKRGIIFIDLAIAQIAGLAVVIAKLYIHTEAYSLAAQMLAFSSALAAGYGFKLCEAHFPEWQEPIIGAVYVFASSLALVLLARDPHGAEAIEHLLSGQLLWVSWQQIAVTAGIYIMVLVTIFHAKLLQSYFYFIFAIAITLSVQLAGVFLVFACLILPALGAMIYMKNNYLQFGYITSLAALVCGIGVSYIGDIPAGPVIVCMLFSVLCLSMLLAKIHKRAK